MRKIFTYAVLLMVLVVACGGDEGSGEASDIPDLPPTSPAEFEDHLADIDRPAVVNIWASWCLPCRAEAPLLNEAFDKYGDRIEFIGVDVQDNQGDAKEFLAEFGLDFDHFFDPNRAIPNHFGGIGTPITFFFGPNGELVKTHNGVVDEQTLALNIDELLQLS